MIKETNLENEKHLNSLASYKKKKGEKMEKKEGFSSRGKKIIFRDQKVQGAYEELKKVVEEKKIDVMKLFL